MAEEQPLNTPAEDSKDPILPVTATTEYVQDDPLINIEPEIKLEPTDNPEVSKESINVIVNIPQENKKIERIALIAGTLINLILAVFTYLLFTKTIEANQTSKASLIQTQTAVNESKRANDIAEASSISSDAMSKINLDLTKQSIQEQINSIREAQKQFNVSNEPFLQVIDFKLFPFDNNKKIEGGFNVINLKATPVKIIGFRSFLTIDNNPVNYKHITKQVFTKSSFYCTNQNYVALTFSTEESFNSQQLNSFMANENLCIYFCREIKYQNLVNGQIRIYRFQIKTKYIKTSSLYTDNTYWEFVENENFDEKVRIE